MGGCVCVIVCARVCVCVCVCACVCVCEKVYGVANELVGLLHCWVNGCLFCKGAKQEIGLCFSVTSTLETALVMGVVEKRQCV